MLTDKMRRGIFLAVAPAQGRMGRLLPAALLILLAAVLLTGPGAACADENVIPSPDPVLTGSKTFPDCVRIALKQSPYFTSSNLEMDVRRLDVSDSKFALIPSVSIHSRYYFDYPSIQGGGPNPYSLGFVTESYNPVEAFFSIKARKLMSRIAMYDHLRIISESIARIGAGFIELQALNDISAYQKGLQEVTEQSVAYVASRINTGGATVLDSRMAEQESEVVKSDARKIDTSRATIQDGLKALLGIPQDNVLDLDVNDAGNQVLDRFQATSATLEEVRSNSYELKIDELKKELQGLNITLSYTKFLPTVSMRLETTDPLSGIPSNSYYFSVGFEMPLWDGFKRPRDVTRQKTVLKQVEADAHLKQMDLGTKWKEGLDKMASAAADVKLAGTQEELAGLKSRQTEISYQAGRLPFSNVLADKKAHLEALKNTRVKKMEYDKAVLNLRFLSGELSRAFVDAKLPQD